MKWNQCSFLKRRFKDDIFTNGSFIHLKVVPAVVGTAGKVVSAKAAAVTGIGSTLLKATPIIGPVVVGAGKLTATIALALKAATAVIGVGKISILPVLIASLVYYNYDFFDPENRPFNVKNIDAEYGWFNFFGFVLFLCIRVSHSVFFNN